MLAGHLFPETTWISSFCTCRLRPQASRQSPNCRNGRCVGISRLSYTIVVSGDDVGQTIGQIPALKSKISHLRLIQGVQLSLEDGTVNGLGLEPKDHLGGGVRKRLVGMGSN